MRNCRLTRGLQDGPSIPEFLRPEKVFFLWEDENPPIEDWSGSSGSELRAEDYLRKNNIF